MNTTKCTHESSFEIPSDILIDWQETANILAELFHIPAALIMQYKDPHIEVLVSSKSKGNPFHPGDKEILFGSGLYCEAVLKSQDKLLVPDALSDEKWKNNPDIRHNMIAYLGFPILLPNKQPFGTICILDNKPNEFSETIERLILKFRDLLEAHLETIYNNKVLGDKNKQLKDCLLERQKLHGLVPICMDCKSIRDSKGHWHPIEYFFSQNPEITLSHGICPQCMTQVYPDLEKDF